MLKFSLVAVPIIMPCLIGWSVWVTQRITTLETNIAVGNKVSEQIAAADSQSHEILHQRILNEIGVAFGSRFDEMRAQMTIMQKDILRCQLLIENKLTPLRQSTLDLNMRGDDSAQLANDIKTAAKKKAP